MLSAAGVNLTFSPSAGRYFQGPEGSRETSEGEEIMSSYCEIRAMNYLFGLMTDWLFGVVRVRRSGHDFSG
jgi:hypothetical protein